MSEETLFPRHFKYVVYKITFPNGKIYVGKDHGREGHTVRYFGSWDWRLIEADFSKDELSDFSIRREILFESEDKSEIIRKEVEAIVGLGSNKPELGYNRWPRLRSQEQVKT
jgi:hypothetical protein